MLSPDKLKASVEKAKRTRARKKEHGLNQFLADIKTSLIDSVSEFAKQSPNKSYFESGEVIVDNKRTFILLNYSHKTYRFELEYIEDRIHHNYSKYYKKGDVKESKEIENCIEHLKFVFSLEEIKYRKYFPYWLKSFGLYTDLNLFFHTYYDGWDSLKKIWCLSYVPFSKIKASFQKEQQINLTKELDNKFKKAEIVMQNANKHYDIALQMKLENNRKSSELDKKLKENEKLKIKLKNEIEELEIKRSYEIENRNYQKVILELNKKYNKAFLNSAEAVKALWGEELNETTRKRLVAFIKKGYLKAFKTGDRGKYNIPIAEIAKILC